MNRTRSNSGDILRWLASAPLAVGLCMGLAAVPLHGAILLAPLAPPETRKVGERAPQPDVYAIQSPRRQAFDTTGLPHAIRVAPLRRQLPTTLTVPNTSRRRALGW